MKTRVGHVTAILGRWRLMIVIAVAIGGYVLASFGGLVLTAYQLNQRESSLQGEVKELQLENEQLETAIRQLSTDEALEKLAREELGWTKPGETGIVVVPKDANADRSAREAASKRRDDLPIWRRWWDLFFGS